MYFQIKLEIFWSFLRRNDRRPKLINYSCVWAMAGSPPHETQGRQKQSLATLQMILTIHIRYLCKSKSDYGTNALTLTRWWQVCMKINR